ncbi:MULTISPECIES: glycoside hydrolase family 13 protein [Bacillus]|uniref:glycoside hydrolase family 13 protein n=1 Tax=Bacillus TaxID=1386 RepID=UPI0011156A4D|nr:MULTISPECIES: alpha-glucosidase [Bacillus]MBJ8014826.1 alpha-glucosidase [Bacillus cereus group sp. N34]MED1048786.1 alpha-glucosidase [Bacillus mycoides]MED1053291.1 alpha-glucosidase [Bacillus mycoides]QWH52190.1 alpha-glucosidase [Bacillus mycoides]QWI99202.1 alpha-glucosidase [Bacillus mycoides]
MGKQWWKESVVYQIYPRSFMDSNGDGIGDLRGILAKLDYLKELGIDVIWLSPVYESPNDDNGYDISDYCKIMNEFGTMEDWDELLHEMHKRNMKLMMDLVVNHTSDEHNWFIESCKSKDNKYRDYYIWRPGKEGKEPNNWGAAFSGSAWQYDEMTDEYYLHLFSKKQPDLNWDNEKVRQDVYDMMKFWLEKGIDGFRMDVINFISKEDGLPSVETDEEGYVSGHKHFMNGPNIHKYLHEMNEDVLSQYDIMTVGEMPGVTTEEAKLYTGEARKELQMVFQFEHMDLDSGEGGKWDVKRCSLLTLKQNLTKWQKALEQTGWNSLYWNNHDQPRVVSRFGNDGAYHTESAKMLATVLHMMKGTPYIYQGEEIGMTNVRFESIDEYRDIETLNMYKEKVIERGEDIDKVMQSIYIKGRDNARTPMQWDDREHAGFTTGEPWIAVNPNYKEINVKQAIQDEESIFYYYKKLIELRKNNEIVVYGTYDLILENNPSIFAYVRTYGEEKLLVIANFTADECVFELPEDIIYSEAELLIHNYDVENVLIENITLRPYEAMVFKLK